MNANKVIARFISLSILITTAAQGADFKFNFATVKTFRQNSSSIPYREGSLQMVLHDGSFTWGSCAQYSPFWFDKTAFCPTGATAYVANGPTATRWGSPMANYYYEVASITDAAVIEPYAVDHVFLRSAPMSTLPRPAAGFADASYDMFYDITGSSNVEDHRVTIYGYEREYSEFNPVTGAPDSSLEKTMDAQIKPGIYQYSFPRLGSPDTPVSMPARYFPIAESYRKVGSVTQGVKFITPNVFAADGFAMMNLREFKPITWQGMKANANVFTSIDKLYFSFRAITDPTNVNSPTGRRVVTGVEEYPLTYFPGYTARASDRILLANALVTKYTIPLVTWRVLIDEMTDRYCEKELNTGTKGMVELDLVRAAPVNGVIYDNSQRIFQLPAIFGDCYEAYAKKTFGAKAYTPVAALDADFDGDGFNNMTEWALKSNAASKTIKPLLKTASVNYDPVTATRAYYGFLVTKSHELVPALDYVNVLRSTDNGVTWAPMVSDADWLVVNTQDLRDPDPNDPKNIVGDIGPVVRPGRIGIQSKRTSNGVAIRPPGTEKHLYTIEFAVAEPAWPPT